MAAEKGLAASARVTADLVGAARAGDGDAFARIFRRFEDRLLFWIRLNLGPALKSRLEPQDVLQEAFLEAHRSLASYDDQGDGSFFRWLTGIARNRILDFSKHHRAQRRDAEREVAIAARRDAEDANLLALLTAGRGTPSLHVHRADLARRLGEAILRLDSKLRDVLAWRAIEDLTFDEIGQRLGGITPGASHAVYVRALRELKRELCVGTAAA